MSIPWSGFRVRFQKTEYKYITGVGKVNKRKVGAEYEQLASDYLVAHEYTVVERNLTTPYGEIDIIAKKGGTWIFCEVKYRSSECFGSPLNAVDIRKQKKISRAALYYYSRHGFVEETPCRFDVIAVYGDRKIEHVENAFLFQA